MRMKVMGLVLGCGLLAAAPAIACSFNTQASSDAQTQQQMAQAQPPAAQGGTISTQ